MSLYLPYLATIKEIREETPDIKTLKLVFQDKEVRDSFAYKPGQFVQLSVFGAGEAPFCISSPPTENGSIECSIKRMGRVTQALHELDVGDVVGVRGPYGNSFPIDQMRGKNLIFVGGGIGLASLRPLIWHVLENRTDFKDILIIYGARRVTDLVYKEELKQWQNTPGITTVLTVDPGGERQDWRGRIGLVPVVLEEVNPSPSDAVVITCGPPIMIKFVLQSLDKMKFNPQQVITTLEMKMKCGIGLCGRCNIGNIYVCKDGPVFTYQQIKGFLEEF